MFWATGCSFSGGPPGTAIDASPNADGAIDSSVDAAPAGPFDPLFGAAAPLTGFDVPGCQFDDPYLSEDELEIIVSASCDPDDDPHLDGDTRKIYIAKRTDRDGVFGRRVLAFESQNLDQYGRIFDGQLFVSIQQDDTERNIFVASRATPMMLFADEQLVVLPDQGDFEEAPTFSSDSMEMIFASGDSAVTMDITRVTRTGLQEPWQNREILMEVSTAGQDFGPHLRGDLLTFTSLKDMTPALYYSERASSGEPFASPAPIQGLDINGGAIDPWLSVDRNRLYFVRRTGVPANRAIYIATRP